MAALAMVTAVLVGFLGAVAVRHTGTLGSSSSATTSPPATASPLPRIDRTTPSVPSTPSAPSTGPSTSTVPSTANPGSSSSDLIAGVVNINTTLAYQHAQAAGTGMVLTADGEILTNNHVISGATSISVDVISTGKSYTATVLGTSPSNDVAVLRLTGASGLTTARLGSVNGVSVGDAVSAVGNAGGRGRPTTSTGSVVALGQSITASDGNGSNAENLNDLIEINASLMPGDSGGPLYSSTGKVIGMNTAASSSGFRSWRSASSDGYAITIETALAVAHQIEAGKASSTVNIGTPGFLGVSVDPASSADGAQIYSVAAGTPAEKAGLQAGDVITAVDGQAIHNADALTTVLHAHKANDSVSIQWTSSDGSTHKADAHLASGPAN